MELLGLYYYWIFAILLMIGFYAVIAKLNLIKKLIGLSMFQEGEQARAMREAGAVTYLTKSGPSEAVIAAIRACCR